MSTPILEERFELERPLRHTDFSTVYLASDRRYLHRPHCLVTAIRYQQREMRHRLEREAQILERLGRQPQIPALLAYFHRESAPSENNLSENTFYLVQDHIVGHPLSQELTLGKPLSESYVTKLLQDVLTALIGIHQQGVVHQNLQPQHLIRQSVDGQIFLTEFGNLAKLARSRITANGTLGSTVPTPFPLYAAPEQTRSDQQPPDQQPSDQQVKESSIGPQPASDLYALGLIAVEALTGQRHQDFTYDPQTGLRWREQQNDTNLHLAEFIDRLIRHNWRDRFTTAEAALKTLRQSCDRHQVAHDSRLDTVVVAPGLKLQSSSTTPLTLQPQAIASGMGIHAFPTPMPIAKGSSRFLSANPAGSLSRPLGLTNPVLLKLAIGSIAAVLALGVGVKAYQWGEYRVSHLPKTWQNWKASNHTYPAAAAKDLVPLLADGSMMLRPAAAEAFWNMAVAAANDGVELYALSGHIADAVPTTAEPDYVTGYTLDIGGETETFDRQVSFAKTEAFQWLRTNAQTYGFTLSVTGNSTLGSASAEPWHWRYVGDDASQKIFGIKPD